MNIKDNLKKIQEEVNEALKKSKLGPREVALITVTKNRSIGEINKVIDEGYFLLGENRVQELQDKYPQFTPQVEWHLIGHLQKNKVKYITDKVKLIHSLESLSLAHEINKRMESLQKPMDCLVQVNIAQETSKFGLKREEVFAFIKEVADLPWVKIKGLMNMAPYVSDPEEVRPNFRQMYELFQEIKKAQIPNVDMEVLSMGMTNDFQVAIEEGANMIRIGSAVFNN